MCGELGTVQCLHSLIFSNPRGRNTLLCTPSTPSRVFITAQNPANPALLGWDYLNREKVLFYVNAVYISLIVNIDILTLFLDIISCFVLFCFVFLLSITLYLFIWVLKYFSLLQPKRLTVKIFIKILIQKWIRVVKNCDLGHNFSPHGPPSRQITYIYT